MEFFNTQSRFTGSSPSLNKKVELSINFYDVISTDSIVNVTRSLPKITELPSFDGSKCILSPHGLGRPDDGSSKPEHALPLTICTKHGNASFLPLDCVAKLPEYTQTTHAVPVPKVVHSFYDCILEFPYPPPISSSEEKLLRRDDYLNKCYQCIAHISFPKLVYMYRDYLFCCPSCRYKASVTHYWYKKVMNIDDDEDEEEVEKKVETVAMDNTEIEGGVIFFIDI